MAEWEVKVQLENGAVRGGIIGQKPTPAIFNTGQVILGWVRAYEETGRTDFLQAAIRAGEFLLDAQDEDGSWRTNLSDYASARMPFYTYNTRTAWALYLLGTKAGRHDFEKGALANIDFSLGQQLENGWFQNNCLNTPDDPIVHTIAYCTRGILEVAILTQNDKYLNSARIAADAMLERQLDDGSLPGKFNMHWKPTVNWSCLTGNAQTSIIWAKLFQATGDAKYRLGVERINGYLMSRQLMVPDAADLHGGITGSYPIDGGYGPYEICNWAVKFFMDALMIQNAISSGSLGD
jgi:uncharacterized protein YyaL (SSP411 family)